VTGSWFESLPSAEHAARVDKPAITTMTPATRRCWLDVVRDRFMRNSLGVGVWVGGWGWG
jgi:hypothetical protein